MKPPMLGALLALSLCAASRAQDAREALERASELPAPALGAFSVVDDPDASCTQDGSYRSASQDNTPLVWQVGAWPVAGGAPRWMKPVAYKADEMWGVLYKCSPGVVCDEFGAGRHEGIDYAPDKAAWSDAARRLVLAAADGVVVYGRVGCPQSEGYGQNGRRRLCSDGWGNHVVVFHGTVTMRSPSGEEAAMSLYSRYAHMAAGGITADIGDEVKAGQPLGRMGNSGSSNVPHLHFEVGLMKSRTFEKCRPSKAFDYVVDPYLLEGFPRTF